MSEEAVRQRLVKEGYMTLAADRDVARRIKAAAARGPRRVYLRAYRHNRRVTDRRTAEH
jgi:hypothetical protein